MAKVDEQLSAEELEQLVEFCAEFEHDPVGFVWASYPWGEGELAGKQPDEWQLNLLADIRDGLKGAGDVIQEAIASGHGIGKSALVCFIIQWAMATREDCKGVVTANTQNQLLTKTWSELAKWHRLSICKPMFTYTATAYYSADGEHEKTWRIDALPWSKNNSEAFAGLHNQGKRILVVFDEASAIDDVIWEVVEGALTDSDTEIIWTAFGNPTKNSGRFYDCFHRYRAYWHTKQIDSRDVAVSNKKQLDKWIGQYGLDSDIIRVRVLGQFPMQGDTQLISINDVNAAVERGKTIKQEHYAGFPVIFGVDPAWTGDDLCVVYMRQGNYSKVLLDCPKNDNHVHMAGKIAMLADRYGMTHGFIDQGEGTGIYSAFKEMGLGDKWTIIPFASKPNDDYYANKRAEMWCLLKQWLKDGGAIESKEQIYNDLIAPEAFINPKSGKFQLESKADMKERGIQSPNYADALALTFAQPIKINAFSKMSNAKRAGRVRKAGSM